MRSKTLLLRLSLGVAAAAAGLLGAEGVVAATHPLPLTQNAWLGPRQTGNAPAFRLDPEMGFCPLAPGPSYSELGALHNAYPPEPTGQRARILFLGDSVTCRGRIQKALQEIRGNPRLEWWNAGVESFNSVQAVQWYERTAHRVRPDLVVLTLHPNDLLGTSVCFRDETGRLVLYREGTEPQRVWPWLYESSHFYRRLLSAPSGPAVAVEGAKARSLEAVRRLRARLEREGASLFVFALPWASDPQDWTPDQAALFAATREVAAASGTAWCDGRAALEQAVEEGIELAEVPGDFWHPGDDLARHYALAMLSSRLLEPLLGLATERGRSLASPTTAAAAAGKRD